MSSHITINIGVPGDASTSAGGDSGVVSGGPPGPLPLDQLDQLGTTSAAAAGGSSAGSGEAPSPLPLDQLTLGGNGGRTASSGPAPKPLEQLPAVHAGGEAAPVPSDDLLAPPDETTKRS